MNLASSLFPAAWHGVMLVLSLAVAWQTLRRAPWRRLLVRSQLNLLLGFAVTWGIYVVFVRRNLSIYPVHLAYGIVSLLTCVPLLALMFRFGDWHALLHLPWNQWLWLILSALIGLTLGHVLYYRAIRVMGPIASEGAMLLIPFQTAILAHFLLGERLSGTQWAAGGALILGCTLLLRARFTVRE